MSDMNFNRSPVVAVAVVARNKQNFTFISFNAGTVKEYTVTWIIFIVTELVMERCGEFTIRTEP